MFEDFEVIHRYTRRQATDDGSLIDVTGTAKEAGIQFPTALTRAVWENLVHVPEGAVGQDEQGRLWDIVWMLRSAITRVPEGDQLMFTVYVRNDESAPKPVTLKAICHACDEGEPVVTVLMPDED